MVQQGIDGSARAARLEQAVQRLLGEVGGLAHEALYREPGSGEWSVTKVLAHLAELLPYWARQAEAVAARDQNDQPFGRTHEDPDRIAAVEEHGQDSLETTVVRVQAGLEVATATLRRIPAEKWTRTGRHERRGEMSVEQIVDDFLVQHAEEHVAQVESILQTLRVR